MSVVIDLTSPEMEEQTESQAIQRFRAYNERNKPPIIDKKKPTLNNRNTDTRFDLTKKRRAPTSTAPKVKHDMPKKSRSGGKKECNLGATCPYKDEFQHQQEFAHNNENSKSSADTVSGKGSKLGGLQQGDKTRERHPSTSSASSSSFGTKGQQLGGSGSGSSRGGLVGSSVVAGGWEGGLGHGGSTPHHCAPEAGSSEYVECGMCTALVELCSYDKHLQAHEDKQLRETSTSSDVRIYNDDYHYGDHSSVNDLVKHAPVQPHSSSQLMKQQDEEFEKAELEDLLRMHRQQESSSSSFRPDSLPVMPVSVSERSKEAGRVFEVIEIDDDDEECEDVYSINDISSSSSSSSSGAVMLPTRIATGPKITLAFKFKFSTAPAAGPPPTKVVESFHIDSLLQDVFTYLDGIIRVRAREEAAVVADVKWELRASFGSKVFSRHTDAKETLEGLQISANTLFIVQEV